MLKTFALKDVNGEYNGTLWPKLSTSSSWTDFCESKSNHFFRYVLLLHLDESTREEATDPTDWVKQVVISSEPSTLVDHFSSP
jgi:hypothetical protein